MANSAIFGLKSQFGLSSPSGCVARRARRRREVRPVETEGEVNDYGSQIVRLCPESYGVETVEIEGRGNPGVVTVAPNAIGTASLVVTRRKRSEFQEREGDFALTAKKLFTV